MSDADESLPAPGAPVQGELDGGSQADPPTEGSPPLRYNRRADPADDRHVVIEGDCLRCHFVVARSRPSSARWRGDGRIICQAGWEVSAKGKRPGTPKRQG